MRAAWLGLLPGLLLAACGGSTATPPAARWVVLADEDVPLEGARRVAPAAEPADPIATARERLTEARQRAMRFESAEALTAASEAQQLLEQHVHDDAARELLHLALALRALLESNLEHVEASREALERAARLDPDRPLDDALFPPDIQASYAELVREVRAEPPASVAITAEPAGARVSFDGRDAGDAPASMHARRGLHFVGVRALGHEPRLLPVRLGAEGNAPLSVRLPPASAGRTAAQVLALPEAGLRALDLEARGALADRFDAEVLVRVLDGQLTALSLRDARGVHGESSERAISSWVEELFYEPPDEAAQVLGSGWLWLALGVVVAGAVAGVLGAVLYEPPMVIRCCSGTDD